MNILDIIVHHKKSEILHRKGQTPLKKLKDADYYNRETYSFSNYIKNKDRSGVIAEFKRKSPSKPMINLDANVDHIVKGYENAGASAISILTDENFFGGRSSYLSMARRITDIPILRKDFIIDSYQIHESKAIGADAILLIAEILTIDEVKELSAQANDLGLEVLMELHDAHQVEKISKNVQVVGVNNRDLKTFKTNIQASLDIIEILPDICKISESGIHSSAQMIELSEAGFDGFLIGERFMATEDPVLACGQLINEYKNLR